MGNGNLYGTSDLYVAAWLLFNGLELQEVDHRNKKHCNFIFADRPDRPQLVHSFMCGTATGNLADFVFYIRKAKRLLYSDEPLSLAQIQAKEKRDV